MLQYFKQRINEQTDGMITYEEFIKEALYHPEYGYYMRPGDKIGRSGDFITTSNISDIFGRAIAKWFLRLTEEMKIEPAVCELGAGNGRFASAFIAEWKKISKKELRYYIFEESPYHLEKQKELIIFDQVIKQIDNLEELTPFNGFIFSNELFDALPVHVVENKNGNMMEVMVTFDEDEGRLAEKLVPLKNARIESYLKKSNIILKDNQRIEIPLAMEPMISKISNVLQRGLVITVDYGYKDEEWMNPAHRDGSLRGYYKHQQLKNVLQYPGEVDITSHVHFDSMIRIGEEKGLEFMKLQRQDEFLLSIGLLEELQNHVDPNPFSEVSRRNRAIRSLIMPSGISSFFHVILQKKEIESEST